MYDTETVSRNTTALNLSTEVYPLTRHTYIVPPDKRPILGPSEQRDGRPHGHHEEDEVEPEDGTDLRPVFTCGERKGVKKKETFIIFYSPKGGCRITRKGG